MRSNALKYNLFFLRYVRFFVMFVNIIATITKQKTLAIHPTLEMMLRANNVLAIITKRIKIA